jgi:hypothetical protein
MRRYALVLFFLLAVVPSAYSGQVGSLSTNVGEGRLSLSAGLSYINKDIERDGREDEMTSRQLVVKGSYGLHPNLDLYVKLGFADLEVDDYDFEGRLDALYGVGLRVKIFQDPENKVNVLMDGEVTQFSSDDNDVEADVLDYHLAFIVTNRAGNIIPYGGIRFSETEVDFDRTKYTADKNIGILGGVDYFVNPNVFFNGEVNIFDEEAIYVGVGYKF